MGTIGRGNSLDLRGTVVNQTLFNLPPQTTPFVGRMRELAAIAEQLARPDCHLLTLVGPGGIGKTRLALETAARQRGVYADGIAFVPLQALNSHEFLVPAIAEAVRHEITCCDDPEEELACFLSDKTLLLILDNFEHVLEGVDLVSHLLAAAPGLTILVTSREALNLQEEWLWPVTGMSFPDLAEVQDGSVLHLDDYSAVQLFMERAQRIRADFSPDENLACVVRICSLVEGMPLGLELAAAWMRVLSCEEIAREIGRNLDFLATRARNVEPRHRSMRVALDHSWNLLTPEEQTVFSHLAVFRGHFTRDAATAVTGATLTELSALVDKSLLRHETSGSYDQHELIRQYAEKQLNVAMDDSIDARDRHAQYYLGLLERRWPDLIGSRPTEALQHIEEEIKNVRVGWSWAAIHDLHRELERSSDSLGFFYDTRGWYHEGQNMFGLAAEAVRDAKPGTTCLLLGRLLAWQGVLCNSLNWPDKAQALLEESLVIARQHDALPAIAFSLLRLGEVAAFQERYDEAHARFTDSLALYESVGDRWGQAYVLNWLGLTSDDLSARHDAIGRSAAIFRELGSRWGIGIVLPSLAYLASSDHDYELALQLGIEGFEACQEIGIPWGAAMACESMGYAYYYLGAFPDARRCVEQALRISIGIHLPHFIANASYALGLVLIAQGETTLATDLIAIAYHHYKKDVGRLPDYFDMENEVPATILATLEDRARDIDPEATARRVLAELERRPATPAPAAAGPAGAPPDLLTDREAEILGLVADGLTNRTIAETLYLSTGTIKWYLSQVYSKLGVSSRTQAVARAREMHLLRGEDGKTNP